MYIYTAENIAASEAAEASAAAQAAAAAAAAAARSRLPIGPYRIGAARNRRASSSSASSALHRPRNTVTHPRHNRSRAPMQATPDGSGNGDRHGRVRTRDGSSYQRHPEKKNGINTKSWARREAWCSTKGRDVNRRVKYSCGNMTAAALIAPSRKCQL